MNFLQQTTKFASNNRRKTPTVVPDKKKKKPSGDKRIGNDDDGAVEHPAVPKMISCRSETDHLQPPPPHRTMMMEEDTTSSSSGSSGNISSSSGGNASLGYGIRVSDTYRLELERQQFQDASSAAAAASGARDDCGDEEWSTTTKAKTIQEIEDTLQRLTNVMTEVKNELYHKNLLLKLRFRTADSPHASVPVMKEILQLEAHRDRILRATFALEQLLVEVNGKSVDSYAPSSSSSTSLSTSGTPQQQRVNYLARMKAILVTPAPRSHLQGFSEVYHEVKARIEALSMLRQDDTMTAKAREQELLVQSKIQDIGKHSTICFFGSEIPDTVV